MESTTDFYSAAAAVFAALIGLMMVFVQFKLKAIKEFMIGDGKTLVRRWPEYEKDRYRFLYELKEPDAATTFGRIQDSVNRGDTQSIHKHIMRLAAAQNIREPNKPRGFSNMLKHFNKLDAQYKLLTSYSQWGVVYGGLGMSFAFLGLSDLFDRIECLSQLLYVMTWLLLFIVGMLFVIASQEGLKDQSSADDVILPE